MLGTLYAIAKQKVFKYPATLKMRLLKKRWDKRWLTLSKRDFERKEKKELIRKVNSGYRQPPFKKE